MTKRKQDDRKPARAKIAGSVEWQWMFDAGNALFNAMKDLSALEVFSADLDLPPIHGDLTPSNIIVNNVRDLSVTLVDLGRNYFFAQALTGRGSSDSAFVAPEIREGGAPDPLSDVYSIGQLLQHIGYRGLAPHELVFDGYYDRTALVARFLRGLHIGKTRPPPGGLFLGPATGSGISGCGPTTPSCRTSIGKRSMPSWRPIVTGMDWSATASGRS